MFHLSNGRPGQLHVLSFVSLLAVAGCSPESAGPSGQMTNPPPSTSATGGTGGGGRGTVPNTGGTGAATGGSGGVSGMGGSGGASGAGGSGSGDTAPLPPTDGGSMSNGDASSEAGTPVLTDPGTEGDGTFMIAAPFTSAPESSLDYVVKGKILQFNMNGQNSTLYPGGYTRTCGIYLPPNYVSGTEIPFMVIQDGFDNMFKDTPPMPHLPQVMEQLILAGKIPAMALISASPGASRSGEYDTASAKFAQFVETELLPEAKRQAKMMLDVDMNLTEKREGRGSYGGSSAGACAFTMAWYGNFGRPFTFSGTFTGGSAAYGDRLVAESPMKYLRTVLTAGGNEQNYVGFNNKLAGALKAKGYHYHYVITQGAGHVDRAARAQYLPEAMTWLWRDYPRNK